MASGLEGRIAIVTGASGAIGGAIARTLARAGARVLGTYLTGGSAARRLQRDGGGAIEVQRTDVTSERDSRKLIEGALARHRRLDILVNAAAAPAGRDADLAALRAADLDHVYRVAVMGTFLCCRAAAPELRERGSGSIVNVARPGSLAAGAAAAAVAWLTRGLARMLAPQVRVNAVVAGDRSEAQRGIGDLVLYLASDSAWHVTGQVLELGGATSAEP